jgi:hypothetical protein
MYNPYTQQLSNHQEKLDALFSVMQHLEKELGWYLNFSVANAMQQLGEINEKVANCKTRISKLEIQLKAAKAALPDLNARGAYGFNPTKWFAKEKRAVRQQAAECENTISSLATQLVNAEKAINIDTQQASDLMTQVEKHANFDQVMVRGKLVGLLAEHASSIGGYSEVKALHDHAQRVLQPHLEELATLQREAQDLADKLNRATQLDRELSATSTAYDKAMVHQQCEKELGDGSPRRMISRFGRELDGVNRNLEKLKRRLEQIGADAGRKISKVVFDGSNLCFVNDSYIGLSALRSAVKAVAKRSKTVVVFDASLRRRLKMPDGTLFGLFGPSVTVHVTPAEADETVLDLAEEASAYVVSNDRFADFKDKAAVKQGRVIPHQIVDGKVFLRGGLDVAVEVEELT